MNYIVATTEIVSVLILGVISCSIAFRSKKRLLSDHLFLLLLILTMLLCLNDAFVDLYGNLTALRVPLLIANVFSVVGGDLILCAFGYYIWAMLEEKQPAKRLYADVLAVASAVDLVLQIILAATGKTFAVVDGLVVLGDWYAVCSVTQLLLTCYCCFFLLIRSRRVLGHRALMTVGTYFLLPFLSLILELIDPSLAFICLAATLSLLIVYIGIEAGVLERSEIREQVLIELVNRDTLTGLSNRHAFDESLSRERTGSIGVLFCDLNGLKYVNDHFGHAQGDERITRFAGMLTSHFPTEERFRISGDEFVVLMEDLTEAAFLGAANSFRKSVIIADDIASVGFAYGMLTAENPWKILKAAEDDMYREKELYYRAHGGERRI